MVKNRVLLFYKNELFNFDQNLACEEPLNLFLAELALNQLIELLEPMVFVP